MSFDLDQYVQDHRSNWRNFVKLLLVSTTTIALVFILLAIFVV